MTKPIKLRKNTTMKTTRTQKLVAAALVGALAFTTAQAQQVPLPKTAADVPGPATDKTGSSRSATVAHSTALADQSFEKGYPTKEASRTLREELIFQRAVQTYLWSLPAISIWSMKEGSEKVFGGGYNVLPTWANRINAKTLVTTPNSDVVYAMGYLDLQKDGPLVVEAPAGVQGMFDDFFQRPLIGPTIKGETWIGDVGLAGPDKGKEAPMFSCPPTTKARSPKQASSIARGPIMFFSFGDRFSPIQKT
jgi:hypothetical protein